MQRIDAHQHFWRTARGDYRWLRPDAAALAPLLRDFLPADLGPLRRAANVGWTVLVQAADSEPETDFMLGLAAQDESIVGVVGWVDISDPGCVHRLEAWAADQRFKGVRPMLQDLSEVDWIARAPHPEVVRALIRLGLRMDALVRTEHLPSLLAFARAWPELPVVIDHAAKPCLSQGWSQPWSGAWTRGMTEMAALPHVYCKFSGLLTEMSTAQLGTRAAARSALLPVWDTLLHRFGPRRLMWGSDWPVLTLAAEYAEWVATVDSLNATLGPEDSARLWQGTASDFYGLSARTLIDAAHLAEPA